MLLQSLGLEGTVEYAAHARQTLVRHLRGTKDAQGQGDCQQDMQHYADADVSSVLRTPERVLPVGRPQVHCCAGKGDPGALQCADKERMRTYKTHAAASKTCSIV